MKMLKLSLMGLIALIFAGCQKESKSSSESELLSAAGKKPVAAYNCSDYVIALNVDKTTEPGHTIFTWTITNPNPGNGSGTTLQNLSHWDFVPGTCLDENWQDVLSASYNTGSGWQTISPLPVIEPDPSLVKLGCVYDDVFKFDQGTSGNTPTQYRLVLNGNWGTGELHAYFKSGTITGFCVHVARPASR